MDNSLNDFPGFLGYGGIIAIHADWPAYPPGMGWEIALRNIGNYPIETSFYEIDDIDGCKLFLVDNGHNQTDKHSSKNYHIALWFENILELSDRGFISGVYRNNDYEYKLHRYQEFKSTLSKLEEDSEGNIKLYVELPNGERQELKPKIDEEDEDDLQFRNKPYIPGKMSLTSEGLEKLMQLSQEFILCDELEKITSPLLQINRYDTAIRESSLFLESQIKEFHTTSKYGQDLIEHHINQVIVNNNSQNTAAIKYYRAELRTIMKFVRNDFMHNFKILTLQQCKAILFRINETYEEYRIVKKVYFNSMN